MIDVIILLLNIQVESILLSIDAYILEVGVRWIIRIFIEQ